MHEENQILLLLGEIKGQMSGFIASLADVNKRSDDHEGRIRTIETNQSKQRGVIIGVSLVASTLASAAAFVAEHFHLIGR